MHHEPYWRFWILTEQGILVNIWISKRLRWRWGKTTAQSNTATKRMRQHLSPKTKLPLVYKWFHTCGSSRDIRCKLSHLGPTFGIRNFEKCCWKSSQGPGTDAPKAVTQGPPCPTLLPVQEIYLCKEIQGAMDTVLNGTWNKFTRGQQRNPLSTQRAWSSSLEFHIPFCFLRIISQI